MNLIIKNAVLVTEGMRRGNIILKTAGLPQSARWRHKSLMRRGLARRRALSKCCFTYREPGQTHK